MGRKKEPNKPTNKVRLPPAMTEEALENAMIMKATELAYQQLCDGTASSQVITHYLKLGSTKERVEREILEKQKDLLIAKADAIKNAEVSESLYKEAIEAFKSYNGQGEYTDDE